IVTSVKGNRITLLQPEPLQILMEAQVTAPGAVAVAPGGSTLFAAQTTTGHLYTMPVSTLVQGPMVLDTGGTDNQALLFTPDGKELWAVNGSGNLGVINPQDRKMRANVPLNGRPSSAFFHPSG